MENFEDEDDTHFCNKCHSTISGLDNYVRHRQSGCRSSVVEASASSGAVTYPEILNADAFFSSLELQSSAKQSHPRRSTDQLNAQPRRSGRNLERKKLRQRKDKSPSDDCKDEAKEKLPHLPPVDADFDDLGLPSLGFPELVAAAATTTTSKASVASRKKPTGALLHQGSKLKQHEQQLVDVELKRQHSSDDHRDWLTEDSSMLDAGLDEHNESENNKEDMHEEERHSEEDRYQEQEEEEDFDFQQGDSEVESDDAESDSYFESDDQDNLQFPPRSHTGGKWKPGGTAHEEMHNDYDDYEMDHHHEHPPPSYTGGKWKPPTAESIAAQQKSEEHEAATSSNQQQQSPPPGHTRGKWVPGARADIGATSAAGGYWCSPCGRRLASRLVYERHLLSDLHARRSIQEIDGAALQILTHAPAYPTPVANAAAPALTQPTKLSRRQKILAAKKSSESRRSPSSSPQPSTSRGRKKKKNQPRGRRHREKQILSCEMCGARVRRGQLGKHLRSLFHCRVSGARPRSPRAQRFLLANMSNFVRQCPFQCASCRFYCNTEDTFMRHWRSDAHRDTVSTIEGSFVCSLCDFWCDDNERVAAHIMEQAHQDVVSMINGSVPIVIRRQRVLTCSTCCRRFRYNVQLRHHARESGHEISCSASDEYQSRLTCSVCGELARSLIALQRHQLTRHKAQQNEEAPTTQAASPYFCSFCSSTFKTAHEAILHRRTLGHKEMVKMKKSNAELSPRICKYCEQQQASLSEYKLHLLEKHPESCHRCAKCGELFALSQDVTRHTRENRCTRTSDGGVGVGDTSPKQWKCSACSYACESQAEYLFHEILHSGPARDDNHDDHDNEAPKYGCSICSKLFPKTTLRDHLRKHTGERPFPCGKCDAMFMRRSSARRHRGQCKLGGTRRRLEEDSRERKYECAECKDAFHTKHILRQHMLRHSGKQYKCGLPGCPTVLRTETELKNHRKLVHTAERSFRCDDCSYAGKTKSQLDRHRRRHEKSSADGSTPQYECSHAGCSFKTDNGSHLKRHLLRHTGQKPYKCRHCDYACNNLENLRKHVLLTTKHPGKTIYQCESCENDEPFQTNFSRELKAHLITDHPDKYPTTSHADDYISSIFKCLM